MSKGIRLVGIIAVIGAVAGCGPSSHATTISFYTSETAAAAPPLRPTAQDYWRTDLSGEAIPPSESKSVNMDYEGVVNCLSKSIVNHRRDIERTKYLIASSLCKRLFNRENVLDKYQVDYWFDGLFYATLETDSGMTPKFFGPPEIIVNGMAKFLEIVDETHDRPSVLADELQKHFGNDATQAAKTVRLILRIQALTVGQGSPTDRVMEFFHEINFCPEEKISETCP